MEKCKLCLIEDGENMENTGRVDICKGHAKLVKELLDWWRENGKELKKKFAK